MSGENKKRLAESEDRLLRAGAKIEALESLIEDRSRELYLTNEQLKNTIQYITDALFVCDRNGNIKKSNQAMLRLFIRDESELSGTSMEALFDCGNFFQRFYPTTQPIPDVTRKEIECNALLKNGRKIPVLLTNIMSSEDSADGTSVFIARNISEKKSSETQTKRLIGILEGTSDFVGMAEPTGQVIYLNAAGRRLVGCSPDEDVTRTRISDYHMAYSISLVNDTAIPEAIRHGTWTGEVDFLHRDGTVIPTLSVAICQRSDTGEPEYFSIIARDIRAHRNAEKEKYDLQLQLVQASKLASLGTLSAGVAHELNNPLTAVLGFAQMIQSTEGIDSKTKELAAHIVEASKRMHRITDQLRNFSRKSAGRDRKNIGINEVINSTLVILGRPLELDNIEVALALAPVMPPILGDAIQLESVFQNLIVNSKDAFQGITDNRRKKITFLTKVAGPEVVIQYRDNATGMDQPTLDRIFDPFFTTKDVGKGTGLGMSISHYLVKLHGGKISVSSELGEGTSFELRLPIRESGLSVEANEAAPLSPPTYQGKETKILIVDDEIMVTAVLSDYLHDAFDVETVNDPEIAVERIRNERYSVVLTDLRMPKMSGQSIIKEVRTSQPATPVILMTGCGSDEEIVKTIAKFGNIMVLYKPFEDLKQVKDLIRKELNQARDFRNAA